MPFFTKKSFKELQTMFSQSSMKNLYKKRKIYTANLSEREAHIVESNKKINQLNAHLSKESKRLDALKLKLPNVIMQEEEKMKALRDANEDCSADNWMVRNYYFSYSPLKNHWDELTHIEQDIRKGMNTILEIERGLIVLQNEKKYCEDVLRIINEFTVVKDPKAPTHYQSL